MNEVETVASLKVQLKRAQRGLLALTSKRVTVSDLSLEISTLQAALDESEKIREDNESVLRAMRKEILTAQSQLLEDSDSAKRDFYRFRNLVNEDRLSEWLETAVAVHRDRKLFNAHRADRVRHQRTPEDKGYPGMRYVLLHSLSHALLRRVAVECGYTAASIRERIYARTADSDGPAMAGLLLYTAAPDSEGTLGGLVRLGEPEHLGRLLRGCLHEAEMCASDPLCAEHDPSSDGHGLHSAACHTCLFLPETCCERGNRYLDRAALVRVFGGDGEGFFSGS